MPVFVSPILALMTSLSAHGAENIAQVPFPPFFTAWDIQNAGSSVSREFVVPRRQFVWFEIEFYRSDGVRELITKPDLRQFVGDGSFVWVTEESADSDEWKIVTNYVPGEPRPAGHGVVARMAHSGVMIPVHLVVQSSSDQTQLPRIDQVFKTWNYAHGSNKGVSRTIGYAELPAGSYRVTATTTQETALPSILKTRLYVTYPPKK